MSDDKGKTGAVPGTPESNWKKNQRKFLLTKLPEDEEEHFQVVDAYLPVEESGVSRTLKIRGPHHALQTIDERSGERKITFDRDLNPEEIKSLLAQAENKVVRNRHVFWHGEARLLVDEFDDGTLLARTTKDCPEGFDPTQVPGFKEDVTGQAEWGMKSIAGRLKERGSAHPERGSFFKRFW